MPYDSCHHRRPGPVHGGLEGVSQPALPGKYACYGKLSLGDVSEHFSPTSSATISNELSTPNEPALPSSPGRIVESLVGAPAPSDPVVPIAASVRHSRSGPAVGSGAGVFQSVTSGEYAHSAGTEPSVPVVSNSRSPNTNDDVMIYYQNAGGMNCDVDKYLLATSDGCYDVIVLTETWLDSRTISNQLFGSDYEVFRCDRCSRNSRKSTGGGVLVAVKTKLKANIIECDMWRSVEQVWVRIQFSRRSVFLCGIYIPPDRTRDDALIEVHTQSIMSVVERMSATDEIIVIGDFNLSGITWKSSHGGFLHPDPDHSHVHAGASKLLDRYSTATLRQINHVSNENHRYLDLCFIGAQDTAPLITIAPTPLVKQVKHHPSLVLKLNVRWMETLETIVPVSYNFRNADHQNIVDFLTGIDWENTFVGLDANHAALTLSHILGHAIERHVPKRVNKSNFAPWQTRELRQLKTAKRAALRCYSKHRTLPLRDRYRRLNAAYKTTSRHCFNRYQRQIQRNLKANPKSFWKYVNEQRKESGLPSSMVFNGEVASESDDVCKFFAEKFSCTFCDEVVPETLVNQAASNVPVVDNTWATLTVDDEMISNASAQLKSTMVSGPDGIPSAFLKQYVEHLLDPIRHVFNLSLRTGVFPSIWKTASMFPVHKKGDRRDVNNYRGISCLCAISKLFELVVMNPLLSHCKLHLSDDQHGFFSGRSTMTNLLCLTSHVSDSFAERVQTDAIYTDLSAAFDKINHAITTAKLKRLGISGSMLHWLNSYLVGRTLTVSVSGSESNKFAASSGIPQGSHLGPLIFLLYFNDVNYVLKGPRLSYADDMKLYQRIRSIADAIDLQQDLDIFMEWCTLNRMDVNPEKCSVISFSRISQPVIFDYKINNTTLQRVDHMKDLGVVLDSRLTFKHHVSYVVEKASRILGFIFRIGKNFTNVYCLKSLYCSLVRSTLEYCSAVWNPYYQNGSERIESVQRRFIRYALRRLPWRDRFRLPSYRSRCQLINLESLQMRRDIARAMVVADTLQGRMDCPALLGSIDLNVRPRALRNNSMLRLPLRRTNYGQHSALIGLKRVFNKVASVFDFHLSRQTIRRKFAAVFSLALNE